MISFSWFVGLICFYNVLLILNGFSYKINNFWLENQTEKKDFLNISKKTHLGVAGPARPPLACGTQGGPIGSPFGPNESPFDADVVSLGSQLVPRGHRLVPACSPLRAPWVVVGGLGASWVRLAGILGRLRGILGRLGGG